MKPGSAQPRPSGGFNQGLGNFNEHLDEQAMQQAMKQQALSQQSAAPTGPGAAAPNLGNPYPAAGGGSGSLGGSNPLAPTSDSQPTAESPTIFDTVISQPVEDLAKTILEALHLDKLLGISGNNDTPEQKAKKQAMLKRYNQLTEEQQAVARQQYQERLQRQQQQQQEEEQRKQLEQQQKQQSIQMPSSPNKGPVGPDQGSKKSHAVQKLEQDRKTLGGPQNVG